MAGDEKKPDTSSSDEPANTAPDAVKDPNEKTDGKPGMSPQGERKPDGEADPGGG